MSIKDYFKQKIKLEYNGEAYNLEKGDIPGLRGSGKISIINTPGCQDQEIIGSFPNLNVYADGKLSFVNGINIEGLIEKLEARKKNS